MLVGALIVGSVITLAAAPANASANYDFRLGAVSVTEGNGPTNAAVTVPFTVSLVPGVTLCVFYVPQNGSAVGGKASTHDGSVDFAAGTAVTKLKAGKSTGGLATTVVYDTVSEPTENYGVHITSVTVYDGSSCKTSTSPVAFTESTGDGHVTVLDDDASPEPPSLRIGDVTTAEGNGPDNVNVSLPLRLSQPVGAAVCVAYTTTDGTATGTTKMKVHDGSADYQSMTGFVKIAAGKSAGMINSTVLYDTVAESGGPQSYNVIVTGVTLFDGSSCKTSSGNAGVTIVDGTGQVTIDDDDAPPTVPDSPTGVTATCESCIGTGAWLINVSWTPPVNDGGSAIDHYDVYRSIDGGASFQFLIEIGTQTSHEDVCNAGWQCVWEVQAHNSIGYGAVSDPSNEIDHP